ncbi:hypothetical protein, unlikely [Trypanosoma brucei gambiense DAL972]|uniref:Uncharacterized protein n=1 Tax=Trypanosoma brucei gambiense (strain MHOM/CI/86/DAL972) TaxID=679716 RepID=D0A7V5_TRYB9|nr:hypothetical protein, unlikely [Trypanosoma brucei gambiense DAL972]CBH17756.1 hypothetical protein, unlikely [Trypanosoma brucei gambiense DAL972]|eukprot:XP_011780020.1 hypothetical protein, unlikely [Trypanosoma brucei gambiense DAL972]
MYRYFSPPLVSVLPEGNEKEIYIYIYKAPSADVMQRNKKRNTRQERKEREAKARQLQMVGIKCSVRLSLVPFLFLLLFDFLLIFLLLCPTSFPLFPTFHFRHGTAAVPYMPRVWITKLLVPSSFIIHH